MLGGIDVRAVITVSVITENDIGVDLSIKVVDAVLRQEVLESSYTLTGRIVCTSSGPAACTIAINVEIVPASAICTRVKIYGACTAGSGCSGAVFERPVIEAIEEDVAAGSGLGRY